MTYISSIKTGILIFPMLALFITIPYMIWMYRRYGSINIIKTLIVYSFVLYLESCYLLVILPLPKVADVHTSYSQMINLIPFSFIIVTLLYFTFMPAKNGKTIGSRILNFHFEMENKNRINLFLRSLGIIVYFYALPRFLNFIMDLINGRADNIVLVSIFFSAFMIFIVYLLLNIILILSNRKFPFDKIGRVSYYSDIKK